VGRVSLVVAAFVVLAFILMVFEFGPAISQNPAPDLYVSAWYTHRGIILRSGLPVGNLVPELVPGARGAAFSGLWIHDPLVSM